MGCVESKPALLNVQNPTRTPSEADLPSKTNATNTVQLKASPATSSYSSTPVNRTSPLTFKEPEHEAKNGQNVSGNLLKVGKFPAPLFKDIAQSKQAAKDSQTFSENMLKASQAGPPSPAPLFKDTVQSKQAAQSGQMFSEKMLIASQTGVPSSAPLFKNIAQSKQAAQIGQTFSENMLKASQAGVPSPAPLFKDIAQSAGSALAIPLNGASGAMQAVGAAVASAEILVPVGGVLQLMCALPFPGKSALAS